MQEYEKASFYYAQALLIFYYLIPENDQEERETEGVKRVIHRNQAVCMMKQGRNREAMQEIEQALKIKTQGENMIDGKSLLRRGQIMLALSNFDEAET